MGVGRLTQIFIFVTLTLIFGFCGQSSAQLRAEYLSVKLPTELYYNVAIYDGDDSIYLLGGGPVGSPLNTQILRFNIFSETIEKVGDMPSSRHYGGSAQLDSSGNIYYIGGESEGTSVIKFDPISTVANVVTHAPYNLHYSDSTKLNNNIYIFGGFGNITGILKFNIETLTFEHAGSLPQRAYPLSCGGIGGKAYIFGDSGTKSFLQVDLENLDVYISPPVLPIINDRGRTLAAGDYVYTIGGYRPSEDFPTNGIIQLNPNTLEPKFILVDNFPVGRNNDTHFSDTPSAVYVEKLNKIYFFGGMVGTDDGWGEGMDDIWFIDLDPLEVTSTTTTITNSPEPSSTPTISPDIFTCVNRTDGTYPHPFDCAMFIDCYQEEMQIFTCPPPLLFNPLNRHGCEWPDQVDCDLHCVDRDDGNYPHPHDCSLFIVCHGGILDVFKCPPPLLFDPELRDCLRLDNCQVR